VSEHGKEQDPTFSPERRAALGQMFDFVKGAAALATLTLHSGILKALEIPPGTKWLQGRQLMREAAENETNESLAVFIGTKESGEWIHVREGTPNSVEIRYSDIEKAVDEGANRHQSVERLASGITFAHTHPNSQRDEIRSALSPELAASQRKAVEDILLSPGPTDAEAAISRVARKYFELAGRKMGKVETVIVTSDSAWTIRETGPDAARERRFSLAHASAKRWLLQHREETRAVFSEQEQSEWWRFAHTNDARADDVRADILALLFVEGRIEMVDAKGAVKKMLEHRDAPLFMRGVFAYHERVSMDRIEKTRIDEAVKLLRGQTTFEASVEELKKAYRACGLELTRETIPR
jgi:hypothetical protein